jgi:peptidoglycan/xylan/chitin deacetylase (PgdA/CDA1 family)
LAGAPLPAKSVVLTFDDGYLDNWVHAHPVLQQHGFTALNFLVTGWIGAGPPRPNAGSAKVLPHLLSHHEGAQAIEAGQADRAILRWSEIDAMRSAGTYEFHSHTHRHVRWDQLMPNQHEKRAALERDLRDARTALSRLGQVSDHLCWPQGYYDDDYQAVAAAAGFRYFYTCEMGQNVPGQNVPGQNVPGQNVPGQNVQGQARSGGQSIYRLEVRDRPASWLASRLWIHSRPALSRAYLRIKP